MLFQSQPVLLLLLLLSTSCMVLQVRGFSNGKHELITSGQSLQEKGKEADARIVDVSSNPKEWMRLVGDSADSGSPATCTVHKPRYNYWFGHTVTTPGSKLRGVIFIPKHAAHSQLVAPPISWERVWGLPKCGPGKYGHAMGIWCPTAPEGFVALGCVWRQTKCGDNQADKHPPSGDEVSGFVTLRSHLAAPGKAVHIWDGDMTGVEGAPGSMWRVESTDQAGFSPGLMIASGSHEAPDASRLYVIDTRKIHVEKLDDVDWHGTVRDSTKTRASQKENEALVRFAPTVRLHPGDEAYPVSFEYLLQGSSLYNNAGNLVISKPVTVKALTEISKKTNTRNYYLKVDPSIRPGMQPINNDVPAPVYASVVQTRAFVEFNYFFLYAWQAGQVMRADREGTQFNCVVGTYGEHEGDIEHVSVRVKRDFSGVWDGPRAVGFERHGEMVWFPKDQVLYEYGTHPIVYAALNGHASYNAGITPGSSPDHQVFGGPPEPQEEWWYDLGGQRHFVLVLDMVSGKGTDHAPVPTWAAWRYHNGIVRIGITRRFGQQVPYNDQEWVMFKGRFGAYQDNGLEYGHYIGGATLNALDWAYVMMVDIGARVLGKLKEDILHERGPRAFGTCFHPVCS